jgi:transcriptional regulator with XRE-family HTH domain
MAAVPPPSFEHLLKRHRIAAGLTQEALAERAGLSARAISDMEREVRTTPYRDTVSKLVQALDLPPAERALLRLPHVGIAPPAYGASLALPRLYRSRRLSHCLWKRHHLQT